FRRPFSGFNLRSRATIVRSRIWCSISRDTFSIGPYDLSTARQTSRSFSSRAMYALAVVRNRGAAHEVRIQAWLPVMIPAIFGRGFVCVSPLFSCNRAHQFRLRRAHLHPLDPRQIINHVDLAIVALHKCRAAFHPVTTVVICDVAELPDSGAMNVATEHGIYVIAFRIMRDSSFEFANEADGVFHPPLCIRAKRTVAQAEP